MPLSSLTCPICLATLKPAQPVAEGTRVRCPKCKGAFVAEAEPKPEEPPAEPVAPPDEEAAAEDDDVMEVTAADDDDERPRRRRFVRDDEEDEERPRRRVKKAVTPLWVWLTGGGVALVLLCGCCGVVGLLSFGNLLGSNVSLANYNQIRRNMTEAQVRSILGSPTTTANIAGMRVDTWNSGDSFIKVSFANDRAVVGQCHIVNGSGYIDTQGALP